MPFHSGVSSDWRIHRPELKKNDLIFPKALQKLSFLFDELLHLVGESDVGEIEAAILVIVAIFLSRVANLQIYYI